MVSTSLQWNERFFEYASDISVYLQYNDIIHAYGVQKDTEHVYDTREDPTL